jgi:hypothetical protein
MSKVKSGGGWRAIWYTFKKAREVGGIWKMWRAMRTRTPARPARWAWAAKKAAWSTKPARWPEFCKKSLQAMAADMQGAIKPDFWSTYQSAVAKVLASRFGNVRSADKPVVLEPGADYYQPIEWEDALGRIVGKLKGLTADETFWYFSGRSSNEAGFLLQLFARLYGTNNVNNCSYYCHQASGVGLTTVGSGTATLVTLEDVEHADMVFVIGGNPPSNHPRLMSSLMKVRNQGGKVISINPVVETGMVNFRVPSNIPGVCFSAQKSRPRSMCNPTSAAIWRC